VSVSSADVRVLRETEIPGCLEIALPRFEDARGAFLKVSQRTGFEALGLPWAFTEQFVTRSARGVVRGLHLQTPPADMFKLVTCLAGAAFDVVVDLRVGSPAYGRHAIVELSGTLNTAVAIPAGCAHGFLAREDGTLLGYSCTAEYSPEHDTGIRWDSAGIDWPLTEEPVMSERDLGLPTLADFESPFRA
jgi:dTDP-4-dehydrorhamnose 3,5-epimerase